MTSKNLIVARSGEKSLHMNWLKGTTPNFDMVVTFYGNEIPETWGDTEHFYEIVRIKGGKWKGLYQYLTSTSDWRNYDYILLPDDDLLCSAHQMNQIFDFAASNKMDLCQPALDRNSFYSHTITLKHDSFNYRLTNFVELMIPCLSRRMLEATLDIFNESNSGWGMDFYWWEIICKSGFMMPAIIDDVTVTHTRPVGSAGHGVGANGQSPTQDLDRLCAKYTYKPIPSFNMGGKVRGRDLLITATEHAAELNKIVLRDILSLSNQVPNAVLVNYIITQQSMMAEMRGAVSPAQGRNGVDESAQYGHVASNKPATQTVMATHN